MQKHLNTKHLALPCAAWYRLLLASEKGLLAGLTLLLLAGLANPVKASGFYKNFVIINNQYYFTNDPGQNNPNPRAFDGQYFGEFQRGTGSLTLGAEANTFSTNNDDVQPPQLFYRIYRQDTTPPEEFTALNLGFVSAGGDNGSNNKKWDNTSSRLNLVATTDEEGTYVLEVYFRTRENYNRGDFLFDSKGFENNYKGYFKVVGTPVVWNGSQGDSWGEDGNWVGGKAPTKDTDVIIPSDIAIIPVIKSGTTAFARTLTINPRPGSTGSAVLSQTGGELQVYGNFNDTGSGFKQSGETSFFTLAGTNTQAFDGNELINVKIQGGGDKYLRNSMKIDNSLTFFAGKLYTLTDNNIQFNVTLGTNATISNETEAGHVIGVLRNEQNVVQGQTSYFGGIGLDLLAIAGNPGVTTITRVTGPNDFAYSGIGTSKSIRRGFIIEPKNKESLDFSLTFHYLDSELRNTPESNLLLFRSITGISPFEKLALERADRSNNTLTSAKITGVLTSTYTLGNSANPLPVTLVSFTATPTAQGTAILRWTTATETNNKGFGIERQLTSEAAWQPVGYLASGNNANGGTYEYTDKSLTNAAFSPQAYYRLRQEDQDGKVSYSPVAVVSRSAMAASSELLLSPVPVTGSNISLTFAEANQAGAEITITNTQGQRLFSQTTQASTDAALSLPVERLAAGVYIVSVRVPGQAVRHARFVKL